MHPLGEGGAVSQVTKSGTKWQRKVKEEGEREEEEEEKVVEDKTRIYFYFSWLVLKKLMQLAPKARGGKGLGPIASCYCPRDLAEQQTKLVSAATLSCSAHL